MWEFDVNGEMYHEKAINFLGELFTNWKNQTCQHDVTITLFSRVFYDAKSKDDFPGSTGDCIKLDHKNRYFEDFYRVVYQNECYEDWMFALIKLKRLIKEYRSYILHYHERQQSEPVPLCYLSNAAEGNFLETLNVSSSVFERHFIDRPFDRTGMMSLIITGGGGVFEVSRNLSKITKERVIDNGIGSDLVCLGEQPLHSVPLFKYSGTDTFSVPYWINLSFYKSSETVRFCNSKFIPRVKIKPKKNLYNDTNLDSDFMLPGYDPLQSTFDDSDEIYIPKNTDSLKRAPSRISAISETMFLEPMAMVLNTRVPYSKFEDPDDDSSLELDSDPESTSTSNIHASRKKINPFSPSTIKTKMSFDRRRWAHLFPLKPDGSPIFQHWLIPENSVNTPEMKSVTSNDKIMSSPKCSNGYDEKVFIGTQTKRRMNGGGGITSFKSPNAASNSDKSINKLVNPGNRINETDIAGDETIASIITGVAWKSLTIPACLPLTTDYCPSQKSWNKFFVNVSNYNLLLGEIREQYNYIHTRGKDITMKDVVTELVGHRLAMGFQLIKLKPNHNQNQKVSKHNREKFMLSLGRMYHELMYEVDDNGYDYVNVTISVPAKDMKIPNTHQKEQRYDYRFQVPDSKVYHVSYCELSRKDMKTVKWNDIDRYICIQGNGTISPLELQNCWRQRLYLLPTFQVGVTLINELQKLTTSECSSIDISRVFHFDKYQRKSIDELKQYREKYFICFMEYLNKVTRASESNNRITLNSSQKCLKVLPSPVEKLYTLLDEYRQTRNGQKKEKYNEVVTYLEDTYINAMLNSIPFLTYKNDIPVNCFISAEATWWCMQNVIDIDTESNAIDFLQVMLDFNIIQHISKDEKNYIHGFYLYYIITKDNKNLKFDYTKDYCEVGLCVF